MEINLIVAKSKNNVIGKDNKLLWQLSDDLKKFKQLTSRGSKNAIIMGRKTYESIGRSLPGRTNVVITRNKSLKADNCIVVNSIAGAIKKVIDHDNIFIIGGGEIYKQSIESDLIDKIFLTEVDVEVEGDSYFNTPKGWNKISEESYNKDDNNEYDFTISEYVKMS